MEFSLGTFFVGIIITIGGVLMVRFYKEICDNLVGGINYYDKARIAGLAVTVFGILWSFGLIKALALWIVKLIFPGID